MNDDASERRNVSKQQHSFAFLLFGFLLSLLKPLFSSMMFELFVCSLYSRMCCIMCALRFLILCFLFFIFFFFYFFFCFFTVAMICLILLFVSAVIGGAERKFVADKYSFLDVFGSMLTGSHLPVSDDRYGGTKCAGCTIVLILVESLSAVHGYKQKVYGRG